MADAPSSMRRGAIAVSQARKLVVLSWEEVDLG